ncbi:thiol protease aleurain-like protein [Tanacetum coccineum]|uniref:Thiol protease aleurain-like protein n=1 Tax=Tanacetum coccineum TaxID=301880 RepID=A0ABQ5GA72_9ASTR
MTAAYPYTISAIKYNDGLDSDETYPYTRVNGFCKYSLESVVIHVLDVVNITIGAEDELKPATCVVRPVSVAFQVIANFRLYIEGVLPAIIVAVIQWS